MSRSCSDYQPIKEQNYDDFYQSRFVGFEPNMVNCKFDYLVASFLKTLHDYKTKRQTHKTKQTHAEGVWVFHVWGLGYE